MDELIIENPNKDESSIKNYLTHPFLFFILKKMLFYSIVLIVSLTLIFFMPRALPGDPATRILPLKDQPKPMMIIKLELDLLTNIII